MLKWVPVETGQPEDLRNYVPWEQTLSSDKAWTGIHLQQTTTAGGELPEGYLPRHLVYLHVGDPVVNERYVVGQGWHTETLRAGNILVLPAGVPFAARWRSPTACLEVHIEPEFVSRTFDQDRVELISSHAENDPLIVQILHALRREAIEGLPRGRLYGECLGTALAAHLVRYFSVLRGGIRSPRGMLPRNRLRRVLDYIRDRLDQNLSLTELADLVGLNADYFSRAFKHTTGLSPHRYVLLKRIERACALLRDPSLSISEITARCGFASQSSFTTAFRRIKGITPSAYRHALL
jgi:AraC family transcriptional regulator